MNIYKFKDLTDGHLCYIVALTSESAIKKVKDLTSIPVELVESRPLSEHVPLVFRNNILPF